MNFKNLESDDILISPFEVNKTFTVTNNDSGSGVYSIPITKGRIYLIYLKFANAPYDTNVNVVFKWDITS